MTNTIHIGKIIYDKLHEQGRTAVWLSKQLGYDRTKVQRIFKSKDLYSDTILNISEILDYDFFLHFSKLLKDRG